MSEKRLDDELAAIEAVLGSLTPAPSSVRRDRLMFLAGRASAKPQPRHSRYITAWLWPCALSASLMAAVTFGLLWSARGTPQIVERVVYVSARSLPPVPEFSPVSESPSSPWENRRLCKLVLEKGVDAMPQLNTPAASTAPIAPRRDSYRDLIDELLKESPS